MRRKLPYILTLLIVLGAWGMFRAVASSTGRDAAIAWTNLSAHGATAGSQAVTNPPLIPVTGQTQPGRLLLVYGLIGVGTLVLILALLSVANRSTTLTIKRRRLSGGTEEND